VELFGAKNTVVPVSGGQDIIVIGAGPAGLTAADEVLRRGLGRPVVLEADGIVGGLSRTVEHHGNRLDIGGHRFFSKDAGVMRRWQELLPLQGAPAPDQEPAAGRLAPGGPDPATTDPVMLWRGRRSRIHFHGRLLPYPLTLGWETFRLLGPGRLASFLADYAIARAAPRPERTLADFYINRFGGALYRAFFRDYTAKVWGTPATAMRPDWGAQRVRSLSVGEVLRHALRRRRDRSLAQRDTATSLIESFLYPKFGPGQLWERLAAQVVAGGGRLCLHRRVDRLELSDGRVIAVGSVDPRTGERERHPAAAVISTMPVDELVAALGDAAPAAVQAVGRGLRYRAFITVGLRADRCHLPGSAAPVRDNWIYVQDRDRRLARLQFFHNWSPYLVAVPGSAWIGCEFFCDAGDAFWRLPDDAIADLAVRELAGLGFIDPAGVDDRHVVRMAKAYPSYGGSHHRFGVVREFLDGIANLCLAGRNGMHRYNNMDHAMLAAQAAVAVLAGTGSRAGLWAVNAEAEYHEEHRR
jgi:protoporphyrinogen oxidase